MFDLNGVKFDFPLAYILVMFSVFMICLVAVVYSSAQSFKLDLLQADFASCKFNNLVYGKWNHSINKPKGVQIHHKDIEGKFKVQLSSLDRKNKWLDMTRNEKIKLYVIRITINLLVIATLGATGYGIYVVSFAF